MATALKARKELELKVHEALFKNLHMLTLVYPPNEAFKKVFKQDMFVKSNTAGFQQVVYYLLNILDADKLKQIVPFWPLCGNRAEIDFRNEIMKYINELHTMYEYADIPQFATSQVISPGGFKFVKFMFSLSQLVLFVHLKRNSNSKSIRYPLKPSKQAQVTKENLEKLAGITKQINEETNKIRNCFENRLVKAKLEAENVNDARGKVKKSVKEKTSILKGLQKELEMQNSNYVDNLAIIKEQLNRLTMIKEKFEKCEQLNVYLNGSLSEIKHEEMELPSEIAQIVHFENGKLDLATFLKGFSALIDCKQLALHVATDEEFHQQIQNFRKLNNRLLSITAALERVHNEQFKMKEELQKEQEEMFTNTQLQLDLEGFSESSHFNSSPLAVPLPPSPNNTLKLF